MSKRKCTKWDDSSGNPVFNINVHSDSEVIRKTMTENRKKFFRCFSDKQINDYMQVLIDNSAIKANSAIYKMMLNDN